MKILVTGGRGFIGSKIVNYYAQNHSVYSLDKKPLLSKQKNVIEIKLDLRKEAAVKDFFSNHNFDVINHHAAEVSNTNQKNIIHDNFFATQNLLKNTNCKVTKKFIFSSSAAVYGNTTNLPISEKHSAFPNNLYGASKIYSEQQIMKLNLTRVIFRYGNVFGKKQISLQNNSLLPTVIKCLQNNSEFTLFNNGKSTRDFVSVEDVARANLIALNLNKSNIYNVSSGTELSVKEIIDFVEKKSGKKLKIKDSHKEEITRSYLNTSKIKKDLKWETSKSVFDFINEVVNEN